MQNVTASIKLIMKAEDDVVVYAPREAILHSSDLLRKVINVRGTAVLVDAERMRLDISHNGAKLIVRLPPDLPEGIVLVDDDEGSGADCVSGKGIIKNGTVVTVTGRLRKEQRRTFLEAVSLSS